MSRVAVVTGGTSGIGAAVVVALKEAGQVVVAGSRRSADWSLDVSDPSSVTAFCHSVKTQLGAPSILVNAAGIYHEARITDEDTDQWHDQIAVNLTGPYLMTQALMPDMIASGFGRIVNIASTAARVGAEGYAGYCASKAGLVALGQVTAAEGAAHNVTCVSVSPTWVETPMMDAGLSANAKAKLAASSPQQRLVQPEEVAALVAFCCGETAPALTNEDIQINAGSTW